jgi:hypothetical protein
MFSTLFILKNVLYRIGLFFPTESNILSLFYSILFYSIFFKFDILFLFNCYEIIKLTSEFFYYPCLLLYRCCCFFDICCHDSDYSLFVFDISLSLSLSLSSSVNLSLLLFPVAFPLFITLFHSPAVSHCVCMCMSVYVCVFCLSVVSAFVSLLIINFFEAEVCSIYAAIQPVPSRAFGSAVFVLLLYITNLRILYVTTDKKLIKNLMNSPL